MGFSAGMLRYSPAGRLLLSQQAPDQGSGDTPVTASQKLAVAPAAAIVRWYAGIPFSTNNRVVVNSTTAAPSIFVHGLGFGTGGRLVCNPTAPITHYLAGIPRTANGAIAIDPVIDPP